jgi:predicted GNAT superfamily acetyltransferase
VVQPACCELGSVVRWLEPGTVHLVNGADTHQGSAGPIELRCVTDLDGTLEAIGVFRSVWGESDAQDVDTYFAAASHGAYLGIASRGGQVIGAAFGLLALEREPQELSLHSHMAAVRPEFEGQGIGRSLKHHQRVWCLERGIHKITWTFDPLQRRNAWFNLITLGATVVRFSENVYGPLGDSINGTDETDRFEVSWELGRVTGDGDGNMLGDHRRLGEFVEPAQGDTVVDIPADITWMRTIDPERAAAERRSMRLALAGVASFDERVVGLTREGAYVIRRSSVD